MKKKSNRILPKMFAGKNLGMAQKNCMRWFNQNEILT